MRNAWRDVHAGTLAGVKHLVADLKVGTSVEHIKCLIGLDVIVQPGLETGLAVLFYDLESVVRVFAGYLDDHLVCLRIDIALARRRMFSLRTTGIRHWRFPLR